MTAPERLAEALIAWAQNEEMIDQHYTQHGRDCLAAAELLRAAPQVPNETTQLIDLAGRCLPDLLLATADYLHLGGGGPLEDCLRDMSERVEHLAHAARSAAPPPQQTEPELWLVEYERTQASGHDARAFFTEQEADEEAENHGGTVASFYRSPPPALEPGQK